MTAMLSSLFSTFTAAAHAHPEQESKAPSRYFNRPKYLIAPEASTLAHPWQILHNRDESDSDSGSSVHTIVTEGLEYTRTSPPHPTQRLEGLCTRNPAGQCHTSRYPRPFDAGRNPSSIILPSMVDIRRMEAGLPSRAAVAKARDDIPNPLRKSSTKHYANISATRRRNDPRSVTEYRTVASQTDRYHTPLPNSPDHSNHLTSTNELPDNRHEDSTYRSPCRSKYNAIGVENGYSGAMGEWVADYLFRLIINQPISTIHEQDRYNAAIFIRDIIMTEQLDSAIIFLALRYIAQLPVDHFKSIHFPGDRPTVSGIIVRAFVIGCVLATKWLEDHTVSAWQWHNASTLPLQVINSMEISALMVLGYNISVTHHDWHSWLLKIRNYHSSIRSHWLAHNLVGRAIDKNLAACQVQGGSRANPCFPCKRNTRDRPSNVIPAHSADRPTSPRWTFLGDFPSPGSWCPRADPFVPNPPRTFGVAPGATVNKAANRYNSWV